MNNNSPTRYLNVVKYRDKNAQPKVKLVKNLGWLLKNVRYVRRLTVYPMYNLATGTEAVLTACLVRGEVYRCTFADLKVLVDWLNRRRSFKGIHVSIYTKQEAQEALECTALRHYCEQAVHLTKLREAIGGV